jgi:hypothetical protein
MKKDLEKKEKLLMTNISVIKNVLTATHTKYRVSKDYSTINSKNISIDISEDNSTSNGIVIIIIED